MAASAGAFSAVLLCVLGVAEHGLSTRLLLAAPVLIVVMAAGMVWAQWHEHRKRDAELAGRRRYLVTHAHAREKRR